MIKIIQYLERTLLTGCLNKMNNSSSYEHIIRYFRYGSNSSGNKSSSNIMKNLNKEDRNQYILPFPTWLSRFVYNLHLSPHRLRCKVGGRLLWDSSILLH